MAKLADELHLLTDLATLTNAPQLRIAAMASQAGFAASQAHRTEAVARWVDNAATQLRLSLRRGPTTDMATSDQIDQRGCGILEHMVLPSNAHTAAWVRGLLGARTVDDADAAAAALPPVSSLQTPALLTIMAAIDHALGPAAADTPTARRIAAEYADGSAARLAAAVAMFTHDVKAVSCEPPRD